jgi:hypothetical protein
MNAGAVPPPAANELIVRQARRLRDFGILQPMSGFTELVSTLRAYEASTESELSREFENLQLAVSKVSSGIEPETLSALLRNELKLPTDEVTGNKIGGLTLTFTIFLGFIFLFAALYYTKLVIEGVGLVSKMNTIIAVDFQSKTDSLVTMIRPFESEAKSANDLLKEASQKSNDPNNVDPALAAVFGTLNELQYYFSFADALMGEMRPLNGKFNYDYVAAAKDLLIGPEIRNIEATQAVVSKPSSEGSSPSSGLRVSIIDSVPAFNDYNRLVSAIRHVVYNSSSIVTMTPQYISMIYGLERDQLTTNIEVTNKWTLPVLYGALGAVLYVLARHFNPFVASLSLPRVLLRITFAMFVAVSISMLLIPANVLSSNIVATPSGIFLLCFIAGYSTDTFIRLLAKLNTYFVMPAGRSEAT